MPADALLQRLNAQYPLPSELSATLPPYTWQAEPQPALAAQALQLRGVGTRDIVLGFARRSDEGLLWRVGFDGPREAVDFLCVGRQALLGCSDERDPATEAAELRPLWQLRHRVMQALDRGAPLHVAVRPLLTTAALHIAVRFEICAHMAEVLSGQTAAAVALRASWWQHWRMSAAANDPYQRVVAAPIPDRLVGPFLDWLSTPLRGPFYADGTGHSERSEPRASAQVS